MSNDADFAEWAAMFLQQVDVAPTIPTTAPTTPAMPVINDGLSAGARALLQAIDAGGVPAFMTSNLKIIALENGLVVEPSTTPNDIIFGLRQRRKAAL